MVLLPLLSRKNGTNFTGLMQLNNDYSLLFYHDGKINMEGLIKKWN